MNRASIHRWRAASRSRGIGLVTAIFLLVVLAGLGVAMVTVFTAQQSSSALDLQGARAYQAARAGIEWGVFRQLRGTGCVAGAVAENTTSFPLPAGTSLAGFVVTVTCTPVGAAPQTRWVIVATACTLQPPNGQCPGRSNSPDYVERTVEVQL